MVVLLVLFYIIPAIIGICVMAKIYDAKLFSYIYLIVMLFAIWIAIWLEMIAYIDMDFWDYIIVLFLPVIISYLSGQLYLAERNYKHRT